MEDFKKAFFNTDAQCTLFFNIKLKCRFLDKILPIITYIGSAAVTVSICALIIGLGDKKARSVGIEALASLIISHIVVEILKRNICRERPKNTIGKINVFNVPIDLYSFPSGHTTAVFSIATVISIYSPVLSILCFPIALIVSASRLYLGVHYFSDVMAAIIIATVVSVLLHFIFLTIGMQI
ncbi:MAG: phosphatase PAP2 family protein [Bacillota bacterium]|nr:phosphatase PAP2 family protein [Bacillota bacterium]